MKFSVSQEAAKWFIDEFGLESGDHIQLFTKVYGGIPTVFQDYYLGISVGEEGDSSFQVIAENITFSISSRDAWLLDEYKLKVELQQGEAAYVFERLDE